MINKNLRKAWNEFRYMIYEIEDKDTPLTIFQRIKDWYEKIEKIFHHI